MIQKLGISLLFLAVSQLSLGQNESDALRFSRNDIHGTARYNALGGAFNALGGDAAGSLKNPAGLGVYRDNEFSLSATYTEHFAEVVYYGNKTQTGQSKFNIGSFSITGVQNLNQAGKWRNTAISFGINRVYDFHDKYYAEAKNVNTSILDDYTQEINNIGVDWQDLESNYPFDLYLLWYNLLLENVPGQTNQYYNASGTLPIDQAYELETNGAKRETYFNFGSNYNDKLYLGVGAILSNTRFDRTTTYSEKNDPGDTTTFIDEFSQTYYEEINGRGYSINIGAIYRPIDPLRIGLSFKSPELQNFTYELESDNITIEEGEAFDVISPVVLEYRYRVSSPFQSSLGIAYTFKKLGLISIEADYIDMRMMSMRGRSTSDPFTNENKAIENLLQPVLNVRSGLEYRVTPNISARAGYAHFGNPYKDKVGSDASFQIYSVGAGYRLDQYFFDLSYQYRSNSDQFSLYDPNLVEAVSVESIDHRITLTFGLKL